MEDEKREEKIQYLKVKGFKDVFGDNERFKSNFAVMSLEYIEDHEFKEIKKAVDNSVKAFDKSKAFSVFCNDEILSKLVEYFVQLQRKFK
jgi:hypothetical protein